MSRQSPIRWSSHAITRGKCSPSLATIVKLARALDVQVADLFEKA